jgi:hypothetical protein
MELVCLFYSSGNDNLAQQGFITAAILVFWVRSFELWSPEGQLDEKSQRGGETHWQLRGPELKDSRLTFQEQLKYIFCL